MGATYAVPLRLIKKPVCDFLNVLSRTVSKLWLIIGHIFDRNRESLHFHALAGGDPCEYSDTTLPLQKLE